MGRERSSSALFCVRNAGSAAQRLGCVQGARRRQRAICSCCCSGGSLVVATVPPARSRRSSLRTVRTSGPASLRRHRLQQTQACRTLAWHARAHAPHSHACASSRVRACRTPHTVHPPHVRSKLQLVPEQLVLLRGGHGAHLAAGARDPTAAELARLPRRAAHAHVQLLQPPPGTRTAGASTFTLITALTQTLSRAPTLS